MKTYFFSIIGFMATTLGIIGLFLPLMPTTCFLIVAVWAFSKSNPELSKKILQHPRFGSTISNWMKYKSIDRKTKCTISLSIVVGFSITLLISTPSLIISALLISSMLLLLGYINTRPQYNNNSNQKHLHTIRLSTKKVLT